MRSWPWLRIGLLAGLADEGALPTLGDVKTHHDGAERGEQFVHHLELRYGMTDSSRAEHLEGAGAHNMAALRLQIHGTRMFSHS